MKIIGKTKSGKDIYDRFSNENNNFFNSEDHNDASKLHAEMLSSLKKSDFNSEFDFNYAILKHRDYSLEHGNKAEELEEVEND